MLEKLFEKVKALVKVWWNKPIEKRGLRAVLFGEETMTVCIILLVGGILLGVSLLILQLCSVEIKTRENIIGVGCFIMMACCVYILIPAVRALNAVWKKVLYVLLMPILFSIIISLSQWLVFLVIGGLICGILCKGFFGGSGVSVPIGGDTSAAEPTSSNYGKLYEGITGDYIHGDQGDEQRITQNLGGGDVRTETGERYHIDENGYATKR